MKRPLKRGILGASTIIISKDIEGIRWFWGGCIGECPEFECLGYI